MEKRQKRNEAIVKDGYDEPITNIIVSPKNREYIRKLKKALAKEACVSRLSYYDFFNLLERDFPNEELFVQKLYSTNGKAK